MNLHTLTPNLRINLYILLLFYAIVLQQVVFGQQQHEITRLSDGDIIENYVMSCESIDAFQLSYDQCLCKQNGSFYLKANKLSCHVSSEEKGYVAVKLKDYPDVVTIRLDNNQSNWVLPDAPLTFLNGSLISQSTGCNVLNLLSTGVEYMIDDIWVVRNVSVFNINQNSQNSSGILYYLELNSAFRTNLNFIGHLTKIKLYCTTMNGLTQDNFIIMAKFEGSIYLGTSVHSTTPETLSTSDTILATPETFPTSETILTTLETFPTSETILTTPATLSTSGTILTTPATLSTSETILTTPATLSTSGTILTTPATLSTSETILTTPATFSTSGTILPTPVTFPTSETILTTPETFPTSETILTTPETFPTSETILTTPPTVSTSGTMLPRTTSTSSSSTGAIAGGVVGGIVLIFILFVVIYCCCRRRKEREELKTTAHSAWTLGANHHRNNDILKLKKNNKPPPLSVDDSLYIAPNQWPESNSFLSVQNPPPVPDSPRPGQRHEFPTAKVQINQEQEMYTDLNLGTNANNANNMYADLSASQNAYQDMYTPMETGENTGTITDNVYADLPTEAYVDLDNENTYAPLSFNQSSKDEYSDLAKK